MGKPAGVKLSPGEAALIHTGGMLPEGADAVVMVENTRGVDASMIEAVRPVARGRERDPGGGGHGPGGRPAAPRQPAPAPGHRQPAVTGHHQGPGVREGEGGPDSHRRRAGAAGDRARTGPDPQHQRLRPGGPGGEGGRGPRGAGYRPRQLRLAAGDRAEGPGAGGHRGLLGGQLRQHPGHDVQGHRLPGEARGPGARRGAASGQAYHTGGGGPAAGLRPAGQPGLGHDHLRHLRHPGDLPAERLPAAAPVAVREGQAGPQHPLGGGAGGLRAGEARGDATASSSPIPSSASRTCCLPWSGGTA